MPQGWKELPAAEVPGRWPGLLQHGYIWYRGGVRSARGRRERRHRVPGQRLRPPARLRERPPRLGRHLHDAEHRVPPRDEAGPQRARRDVRELLPQQVAPARGRDPEVQRHPEAGGHQGQDEVRARRSPRDQDVQGPRAARRQSSHGYIDARATTTPSGRP